MAGESGPALLDQPPVIRVALDGTPLLGQRTGIGRYTEHLLTALGDRAELAVSATAFSLRGAGGLRDAVPPGVRARSLPAPARLLRTLWSRFEFPPVRPFSGPVDVFHATNFVLPPTGRAGGVVTIHDLAYLTRPDTVDATSRQLVDLVPRSLARAAVVCTPTRAVADQVREAYGPAVRQVVVTPLGVDPGWLSVEPPQPADRVRLGLPPDYLLFVGTREPRKALDTLVAAYRHYHDSTADAPTLLLVGARGWGPGLGPAGSDDQPGPGVRVRDYTPADELRTIVAGARAVVMPSRDEGFGLPALEGLAAGVPVIVSDIPALLEVTDGRADVFPMGEIEALADLLGVVTERDRGLAPGERTAARRARRDFAAGWTWLRCADATVRAYRLAVD